MNPGTGCGKVPAMPAPLSRFAASACLALGLGLGGCAASSPTEPYFIVVQNQTIDPQTKRALFSICYNRLLHSQEEIRSLVSQHCADPILRSHTSDMQRCSLSAPVRATFACTAISRTAAEAKPNLPPSSSFTGAITF